MGEGSLEAASAPLPSRPLPSASFCLKGGAVLRGTGPEVGPRGRGGAWSQGPEPTVRGTAHPVEGQFRSLEDSRWKSEPQLLLGVLWGSGLGTCAHKVPPNTPRLSGGPCSPGRPGPLPSVLTPAAFQPSPPPALGPPQHLCPPRPSSHPGRGREGAEPAGLGTAAPSRGAGASGLRGFSSTAPGAGPQYLPWAAPCPGRCCSADTLRVGTTSTVGEQRVELPTAAPQPSHPGACCSYVGCPLSWAAPTAWRAHLAPSATAQMGPGRGGGSRAGGGAGSGGSSCVSLAQHPPRMGPPYPAP